MFQCGEQIMFFWIGSSPQEMQHIYQWPPFSKINPRVHFFR
uniref:Uncharacterized protein n=1 Tax=Arundo donax TaxID=35708 RepID=A0A0A9DI58_ARUDO